MSIAYVLNTESLVSSLKCDMNEWHMSKNIPLQTLNIVLYFCHSSLLKNYSTKNFSIGYSQNCATKYDFACHEHFVR